jgi:glucan phosphorylase
MRSHRTTSTWLCTTAFSPNSTDYLAKSGHLVDRTHPELASKPIAYFSMEFGLHETLPIYSGGLGVFLAIT